MRTAPRVLINTPEIELWPAGLLRARSNHDARALSLARRVLRRQRDGRYLASELPEGLLPLVLRVRHEPGIDAALEALDDADQLRADIPGELPLDRLHERLHALGLDDGYGDRSGLPLVAERAALAFDGF